MNKIFLFLLISISLFACSNSNTQQEEEELKAVDELLNQDKERVDSAKHVLDSIYKP